MTLHCDVCSYECLFGCGYLCERCIYVSVLPRQPPPRWTALPSSRQTPQTGGCAAPSMPWLQSRFTGGHINIMLALAAGQCTLKQGRTRGFFLFKTLNKGFLSNVIIFSWKVHHMKVNCCIWVFNFSCFFSSQKGGNCYLRLGNPVRRVKKTLVITFFSP